MYGNFERGKSVLFYGLVIGMCVLAAWLPYFYLIRVNAGAIHPMGVLSFYGLCICVHILAYLFCSFLYASVLQEGIKAFGAGVGVLVQFGYPLFLLSSRYDISCDVTPILIYFGIFVILNVFNPLLWIVGLYIKRRSVDVDVNKGVEGVVEIEEVKEEVVEEVIYESIKDGIYSEVKEGIYSEVNDVIE